MNDRASRAFYHGVTPEKVAREAARQGYVRRGRPMRGWELNALQRRKELSSVLMYRRKHNLALGPDAGWALVIGNLLRVLHQHFTAEALQAEAAALGRPPLNDHAVEVALQEIMGKAWAKYRLYTPAQAGSLIELTTVERDEAGITKMEAVEESKAERRRRENRDRMRSWRAARAAPKPTKKEIAEMLDISLSTLHRCIRKGELQIVDTISVRTSPLPSVDPRTRNVSPDLRTRNVSRFKVVG